MSDAELHQLVKRKLINTNHINGLSSKLYPIGANQVPVDHHLAPQLQTGWTSIGANDDSLPGAQTMFDGGLVSAALAFCSGN